MLWLLLMSRQNILQIAMPTEELAALKRDAARIPMRPASYARLLLLAALKHNPPYAGKGKGKNP